MKSIKTPGMMFLQEQTPCNIFLGKDKFGNIGICWQPTLKERLYILLGFNIMSIFPRGKAPDHFYLKLTKQKESK